MMKSLLNRIADAAAMVVVAPAWILYLMLRLLTGRVHACMSIAQRASR